MQTKEINVLVLAYLGDAVYERFIRKYLIGKKILHVNDLQKEAISYVCAEGQAKYLDQMLKKDFFTEEELDVIRRTRNYKQASHPKHCDLATYKKATELEALLGYLEMENKCERINEIMNFIINETLC